jgi:hypothetical protein
VSYPSLESSSLLPYEPRGVRLKGYYNLAPPAPNVKDNFAHLSWDRYAGSLVRHSFHLSLDEAEGNQYHKYCDACNSNRQCSGRGSTPADYPRLPIGESSTDYRTG